MAASAAAVNILHVFALTTAGALLGKAALRAAQRRDLRPDNSNAYAEKIAVARFFASQVMPEIQGRLAAILDAKEGALALYPDPSAAG